MARRLEYYRGFDTAYWVEEGRDGKTRRTGPFYGESLRQAQAEERAEREIDRLQTQLVELAEQPPLPPQPYFDPGRPVPRQHERELDHLGLPVNSNAVDRVRAGMVTPEAAAQVRAAWSHEELRGQ